VVKEQTVYTVYLQKDTYYYLCDMNLNIQYLAEVFSVAHFYHSFEEFFEQIRCFLVKGFVKIGSCELFAWTDFKPRSS
jgi:hypothetical protein